MIQLRHRQPTLSDGFCSEEVSDLWEPWMRIADRLLEDEALLDNVYDAQAKRHKQSRTRQGSGVPIRPPASISPGNVRCHIQGTTTGGRG